jgi:hypothetical protein
LIGFENPMEQSLPKLGRNDLCWCNSGRKYKRCHSGRANEARLPFAAIASMIATTDHSMCMHPDASPATCGKVVAAHTLQRARVLKVLKDERNKVLTYFPLTFRSDGRIKLHSKGWHQASTFTAFCEKHDASTFAPLETVPFSGTKEQIFLVAYRALCWEVHRKIRALKVISETRNFIDRGISELEQLSAQRRMSVMQAGYQAGLYSLKQTKEEMDAALGSHDYSDFETCEIVLDGCLAIAGTGAITPNRTPSGVRLQELLRIERFDVLGFGVDIKENQFSFLFHWSKTEKSACAYMAEVVALDDQRLAEFLVQFLFAHCENTYFTNSWWEGLRVYDREFLITLVENVNPYDFPPQYELNRRLAPWRVVSKIP